MNRLAGMGLVLAGHHDGVSEIKHLRGHERGRRGTEAGPLLQIESGDAVGLGERMVVARSEQREFIGDVRRPSDRIVICDAGFQSLPGGNDRLLGFVSRLIRDRLAGILARLYTRTRRCRGLAGEYNLMVDEQTQARGTTHPEAQDLGLVTTRHHRDNSTVSALRYLRSAFVAKRGRWKRVEDFRSGASFSIGVGPGEIRVENFVDRSGITFSDGMDKFAIGLKDGLILGGNGR
jgi:hypothetical protein